MQAQFSGIRPFIFGHFGDGNLHYNLSRPCRRDWATTQGAAITDAVLTINRYGGSISAEHGRPAQARSLPAQQGSLELRLMREIKRLVDPAGIMNPGKLL